MPTAIFSPTTHSIPTPPPTHLSTHPPLIKRPTGSSLGVTATFGARWICLVGPNCIHILYTPVWLEELGEGWSAVCGERGSSCIHSRPGQLVSHTNQSLQEKPLSPSKVMARFSQWAIFIVNTFVRLIIESKTCVSGNPWLFAVKVSNPLVTWDRLNWSHKDDWKWGVCPHRHHCFYHHHYQRWLSKHLKDHLSPRVGHGFASHIFC